MSLPKDLEPYTRLSSVAQVGGFRPPSTPRTSWIGQVLLGADGEPWPEHAGLPMWGLCQIRIDELPAAVPAPLRDAALVTLFVDLWDLPFQKPNGDGWEIRTYDSIDELAPLLEPERGGAHLRRGDEDIVLRPFPLLWKARVELPSRDDWPADMLDVYDAHRDALAGFDNGGLKVGGWPHTIQSEIFWTLEGRGHVTDAEFVLQVDYDEKAQVSFGDAGTAYVGWSPTHGWLFEWQCY